MKRFRLYSVYSGTMQKEKMRGVQHSHDDLHEALDGANALIDRYRNLNQVAIQDYGERPVKIVALVTQKKDKIKITKI